MLFWEKWKNSIQCPGRNVLFKKHNLESSLVVYFIIFEILLLANLQTCYIYAVAIFYKYFIGYEGSLKFWWNYIHVCFGSAPTCRNIFFYSAVAWYLGGCKFSTSCIWILQISDSPFFPNSVSIHLCSISFLRMYLLLSLLEKNNIHSASSELSGLHYCIWSILLLKAIVS